MYCYQGAGKLAKYARARFKRKNNKFVMSWQRLVKDFETHFNTTNNKVQTPEVPKKVLMEGMSGISDKNGCTTY